MAHTFAFCFSLKYNITMNNMILKSNCAILSESSLSKDWLRDSMAEFIKGDIIVVPFPFSDLSEIKYAFSCIPLWIGYNSVINKLI